MEPRRKGEVREDERPMEGPFWALEGRWNCRRGSTNFCLRFVSACALDKMAWPAIASGSAGVRDSSRGMRVDVGARMRGMWR
jgi:hypothetical protein